MTLRISVRDIGRTLALLALPLGLHAASNLTTGAGCPMAHCDPELSGTTKSAPPSTLTQIQAFIDSTHPGSALGLGCSSNQPTGPTGLPLLSTVACSFSTNLASNPRNLGIYDGTGKELLISGTLLNIGTAQCWDASVDPNNPTEPSSTTTCGLNNKATYSAPIVFDDGSVLAVDDTNVVYYYPVSGGWRSIEHKLPDAGNSIPVSPIMVNSNTFFMATYCENIASQPTGPTVSPGSPPSNAYPAPCQISTWKISTISNSNNTALNGTPTIVLEDHAYIYDANVNHQGGGGYFETHNTPSADLHGPNNGQPRVYVLASEICYNSNCYGQAGEIYVARQGRLIAVDVSEGNPNIPDGTLLGTTAGTWTDSSGVQQTGRFIYTGPGTTPPAYPHMDIPGPSGSSPLFVKEADGKGHIYFDGQTRSATLSSGACTTGSLPNLQATPYQLGTALTGCFYGVTDNDEASDAGSTTTAGTMSLNWGVAYPNALFQSAAAQDPNGGPGLWIAPIVTGNYTCGDIADGLNGVTPYRNCVIYIKDRSTGAPPSTATNDFRKFDFTTLVAHKPTCSSANGALYPCYTYDGGFMMSTAANGHTIMTIGAVPLTSDVGNRYVAVIDVNDPTNPNPPAYPTPTLLNSYTTGASAQYEPWGQYPIAQDASGNKRIVFTTDGAGPFFIGDKSQ